VTLSWEHLKRCVLRVNEYAQHSMTKSIRLCIPLVDGLCQVTMPKMGWIYVFLVPLSTIASVVFAFIPKDGVMMLIVIQVIFPLLMGPTGASMFSMYTDVADYLKEKNGNDTEGVAMAVGSFCNNLQPPASWPSSSCCSIRPTRRK
jgi:Na+/melibiose symporter-like transporter